jgi:CBS domain-containing protein
MNESTVASPMTEGVVTAPRDETLDDLAARLTDLDIKSVVVTDDDDRPVGILTSTDYLALVDDGADPAATTVGDRMIREVVTVRYDETIRRAARLMDRHGIGHLPVVDADGRAVGIVSSTDLTAHLARGGD